jgi:hypothetical protein
MKEVAMKKPALMWLLIVGVIVGSLVVPVAPGYAWNHGHGRVFIGVGPGFWWGPPYPYYWYPPPYYPPVVVQQPPGIRAAGACTSSGAPHGLVLLPERRRILSAGSELP